jgi:hypothetical protein
MAAVFGIPHRFLKHLPLDAFAIEEGAVSAAGVCYGTESMAPWSVKRDPWRATR